MTARAPSLNILFISASVLNVCDWYVGENSVVALHVWIVTHWIQICKTQCCVYVYIYSEMFLIKDTFSVHKITKCLSYILISHLTWLLQWFIILDLNNLVNVSHHYCSDHHHSGDNRKGTEVDRGVVAEWSKVLIPVPWPLMVWSTLALGT